MQIKALLPPSSVKQLGLIFRVQRLPTLTHTLQWPSSPCSSRSLNKFSIKAPPSRISVRLLDKHYTDNLKKTPSVHVPIDRNIHVSACQAQLRWAVGVQPDFSNTWRAQSHELWTPDISHLSWEAAAVFPLSRLAVSPITHTLHRQNPLLLQDSTITIMICVGIWTLRVHFAANLSAPSCSAPHCKPLPRFLKSLGARSNLPNTALCSLSSYFLNIPSLPALPSAIFPHGTHPWNSWARTAQ